MFSNQSHSIIGLNLSAVIRNLYGIIRSKIIAILLGMSAVGVLGQILTFFGMQSRMATIGLDTILINRLTKLRNENNIDEYYATINLTLISILIINLLLVFFLIVLIDEITLFIFDDLQYKYLFILLIGLGPLYALSLLFEVITQANYDFKRLVIGRNLGNIAGIITIGPFIYFIGLSGILYSLYFFISFSGIYFIIINRNILKHLRFTVFQYSQTFINIIIKLGLTDLIRKIYVFMSLMLFRVMVVKFIGLEKNGLFQAIWSISFFPDIIINGFISYYFPMISGAKSEKDIRELMKNNFEYLVYMIFPLIAIIMLFSDCFLLILYTENFTIVSDELRVLTFFKFFQAIYLFISITFLGQTKLRAFLMSEIFTYTGLLIGAKILIPVFEIQGAVMSVIIMHIVSYIMISYFLIKYKDLRLSRSTIMLGLRFVFLLTILILPIQNNPMHRGLILILFLILTLLLIDIKKYKLFIKSVSFGQKQ